MRLAGLVALVRANAATIALLRLFALVLGSERLEYESIRLYVLRGASGREV